MIRVVVTFVILICLFAPAAQTQVQTAEGADLSRSQKIYNTQDRIETRIDKCERDGTLTNQQANRLRKQSARIGALELELNSKDRSFEDQEGFYNDLYHLSREIALQLTGRERMQYVANQHRVLTLTNEQIGTRIDACFRTGSLTKAEANKLRRKTVRIGQLERQIRLGKLTGSEHRDLNSKLNSLSRTVSRQIPAP